MVLLKMVQIPWLPYYKRLTANLQQASFAPLNVEIESESEDEIDDSKEIQVFPKA